MNHNSNLEIYSENSHFQDYLHTAILCPMKMNSLSKHLIKFSFLSLYPFKEETKYGILTILKLTVVLLCLPNDTVKMRQRESCLEQQNLQDWWRAALPLREQNSPSPDIPAHSQGALMGLFISFPSSQLSLASSH